MANAQVLTCAVELVKDMRAAPRCSNWYCVLRMLSDTQRLWFVDRISHVSLLFVDGFLVGVVIKESYDQNIT